MKTSREDGILVLKTKKPFKAPIEGVLEDRTDIVCYDVNKKSEDAALNLEQKLSAAFMALPEGKSNLTKKQIKEEEKKDSTFYSDNSPTDKTIQEQANNMRMAVQFNTSVKVTDLLDIFMDIISSKRVCFAGDMQVTQVIWDSIDRHDKLNIMFAYCAFFVNPLEALQSMA